MTVKVEWETGVGGSKGFLDLQIRKIFGMGKNEISKSRA